MTATAFVAGVLTSRCWWKWSRDDLAVTDLDTGRVHVSPPWWLLIDDAEWDNRPENIEPVEHACHASITQEQVRAWAKDEKREQRRRTAGVSDHDLCDGCGEPTEPPATSPEFAGERCLECAKQESEGEPIEV